MGWLIFLGDFMISAAHAQAATLTQGGIEGVLTSMMPIILIFGVLYFFMIRPQNKRHREHKAMVDALKRGDQVVVSGSILGKISKITSDSEVQVEIAEATEITVLRHAITQVVNKPAPQGDKTLEPVAKRLQGRKKA